MHIDQRILDGKKVSSIILEDIKKRVHELRKRNIIPTLAVISFGNEDDSLLYRKIKKKTCLDVGIEYVDYHFSNDVDTNEVINLMNELNTNRNIHGIIVHKPIPLSLDSNSIFEAIEPSLNVDCLTSTNLKKIQEGHDVFVPSTALGILRLLDFYHINIKGLNVAIVGKSISVERPLSILLKRRGANVLSYAKDSLKTEDIKDFDMIISAVGEKYITEDMVKDDAIIIDVGIHYENGKVSGDVYFDDVVKKVSYITPVPFGIGPMTVAMLLYQVTLVASKDI